MRNLLLMSILICAWAGTHAQINFVKNPSFEEYTICPDGINEIGRAKFWTCAVDTAGAIDGSVTYAPEWFHKCGIPSIDVGVPDNVGGYQYPHSGDGMGGALFYYDKTPPIPAGGTYNSRDYFQGLLTTPLQNGKIYCVSFWLNVAEVSGYAHNKIGAYFDDGTINKRSPAGIEITDVVPQFSTTTIVKDTMNWTKVEGSFTATGKETHITLGLFAKNIDVDTAFLYWGSFYQFSYYFIDDVSVIPIDLPANAGLDTWVELGKKVKIGYIKDSATAMGLDCKWYKKGVLIDSGAIISVNANSVKYAVDTYVVVQTICGMVKTDTVMVKTTGLGILSQGSLGNDGFIIYPNPSGGTITVTAPHAVIPKHGGTLNATVYDLLGRVISQQQITFLNNQLHIKIDAPQGNYIIELKDKSGTTYRQRILIQ